MAKPRDPDKFVVDAGLALAKIALPIVEKATPSRTLRAGLHIKRSRFRRWKIAVAHYWAVYYHDGRGRMVAPTINGRRYFVWFPDRSWDPRPQKTVRYTDWRPLTKEEWEFGLQMNEELGGSKNSMAVMVFRRSVGPAPGTFFFEVGLRKVLPKAAPTMKRLFSSFVKSYVTSAKGKAVGRI